MPIRELPRLVEEALSDMEPYDADGALAKRVRERLPLLKKQARARNEAIVNRGLLAEQITGDAAGSRALAAAYAKALYGFEITEGRDDAESMIMNTVKWRDVIADAEGNPRSFHHACDALYSAKSDAEGGVLVIESIYDLPPKASSKAAVAQAQNGAFQMLTDLLADYADRDYTPVVILTGDADKLRDFMTAHEAFRGWFSAPPVVAKTAPRLPPPDIPAATTSDVTVSRPLKLKKPGL
jgi:hypothetical protein